MKPVSAGSNYLRARRRLEKILGEEGPDSSASPTKTKSRAPRKATKKASEVPQVENTDEVEAKDDSAETPLTTRVTKRRKPLPPATSTLRPKCPLSKMSPLTID
jgi:hypothetical protein